MEKLLMANHKKIPPGVLLYTTIMVLCMEQLFTVSMQQLACKLRGCHPVKQFALVSTTCPVCAMLTYLLDEYELALEIITHVRFGISKQNCCNHHAVSIQRTQ